MQILTLFVSLATCNSANHTMSDWDTLVSIGWGPEADLFIGAAEGAVVDIALAQNPLQAISIYYPLKQAVLCKCKGSNRL